MTIPDRDLSDELRRRLERANELLEFRNAQIANRNDCIDALMRERDYFKTRYLETARALEDARKAIAVPTVSLRLVEGAR